jgi:hypothetical protein
VVHRCKRTLLYSAHRHTHLLEQSLVLSCCACRSYCVRVCVCAAYYSTMTSSTVVLQKSPLRVLSGLSCQFNASSCDAPLRKTVGQPLDQWLETTSCAGSGCVLCNLDSAHGMSNLQTVQLRQLVQACVMHAVSSRQHNSGALSIKEQCSAAFAAHYATCLPMKMKVCSVRTLSNM